MPPADEPQIILTQAAADDPGVQAMVQEVFRLRAFVAAVRAPCEAVGGMADPKGIVGAVRRALAALDGPDAPR